MEQKLSLLKLFANPNVLKLGEDPPLLSYVVFLLLLEWSFLSLVSGRLWIAQWFDEERMDT